MRAKRVLLAQLVRCAAARGVLLREVCVSVRVGVVRRNRSRLFALRLALLLGLRIRCPLRLVLLRARRYHHARLLVVLAVRGRRRRRRMVQVGVVRAVVRVRRVARRHRR